MAPSGHYLSQCLITGGMIQWHSSEGKFPKIHFCYQSLKLAWKLLEYEISFKFPSDQWVNSHTTVVSLVLPASASLKAVFLIWSYKTLRRRHNERDGVSNHGLHDCLLNCLFRHRSKKTSKLRVTGLCVGNSPVTGEFPAQMPVTRKAFPFDDVIMNGHGISQVECTKRCRAMYDK